MKRKHLLVASLLLVSCFALVGCDVEANPSNASTNLITIDGASSTYFQNNYSKIYYDLEESGNFNSLSFKHLTNQLSDDDIGTFFGNEDTLKALKLEKILETIKDEANKDDYKVDKQFDEQLFINAIISKGYYDVQSITSPNKGLYVNKSTSVTDMLTLTTNDTEVNYDNVMAGPYGTYIQEELMNTILQNLVTTKYICQKYFSALGRGYARKASYVALPASTDTYGETGKVVTEWLKQLIGVQESGGGTTTSDDGNFDLNSLAKIYRGTETLNTKETSFATGKTNLKKDLISQMKRVATPNNDDNPTSWTMKIDEQIDTSIESTYTGSGKYTLEVGYELGIRDIKIKDLYDSDLYTKTKGISALPTSITDRLFSASVDDYVDTIKYKNDANEEKTVTLLTRATAEADNSVEKYYFYDTTNNAYYIVAVEDYDYTNSELKKKCTMDESGNITSVDPIVANIAYELVSDSYKKEAIIYLLEKANLADNIHDDRFYDYMKENYGDIFD